METLLVRPSAVSADQVRKGDEVIVVGLLKHLVIAVIWLLCLATLSLAQEVALTPDVRAFINRREDCDHFRGEPAFDADRKAELARLLRRFCCGLDAELAQLRWRYRTNPGVLKALRGYDPVNEAPVEELFDSGKELGGSDTH